MKESSGRRDVRLLEAADSLHAMTELLHRAYAPLAALGFRYLGSHQDVETTRRRVARGACYVIADERCVLGTVLLIHPNEPAPYCAWYDRPDVAVICQLAVEPELQGRGLGGQLLHVAEARARELGAREVALDTAAGAERLVRFYRQRGYRPVGQAQWGHANYASVILSKALREKGKGG